MNHENDFKELVDRHLNGELNEIEKERLAESLDADSIARREFVEHAEWDTRFVEAMRLNRESLLESDAAVARSPMTAEDREIQLRRSTPSVKVLMTLATVIIVALVAGLFFRNPSTAPVIARITGLNGSLVWIGDGGQIVNKLAVGTELSGGTIEGMAPDSWVELEFTDGSIITISGNSMLAFSDVGQKELYLKEGNVLGNVRPQPPGKPMLIHTRSAILEVLGTQFEIESGLASTMLHVSKGRVRVQRLSDGNTVEVPAQHRVIAAADRELSPVRIPDSVNHWISQLQLGPDRTYGEWSPESRGQSANLRAIPYTGDQGITIYTASFRVSSGDNSPVLLAAGSRIKVRGHIMSAHKVYFGITVRQPNGEFAGRFQTIRPADEFESGQDFEVVLDLNDYQLDPSLKTMKDKLPGDPFDLIVASIWCHTLRDQAGLEIAEVELIGPN